MRYLVDSDWLIDHLASEPAATALLLQLAADGIAISIITYAEVYQGVLSSPTPAQAEMQFRAFVARVPVLPFSEAAAERLARLRHTLKQQGRRVNSRALDLINAAIALENGLTFVTRNLADYRDIPGLILC